MEYGLIKDTTIQGIAEGLREKGFVDATRIEDVLRESVHYATENVTSDTDATPAYNANSNLPNVSTLGHSPIITEMPGASSIEFIVDIGLVHPDATTTQCGRFEIYGREGTPIVSETINRDYKGKHTYIIPGDYVCYGRNSSYVTVRDCYTAFIVDLYPLDADGNRISYLSQEQVPNTITPSEMVEAISNSPVLPPEEAFVISGDCTYRFSDTHWTWFVECYKDKIITNGITHLSNTFDGSSLTEIPFVLNVKDLGSATNAFNYSALRVCPKIRGTFQSTRNVTFQNSITGVANVRDFEDLFDPEELNFYSQDPITYSFGSYPPSFNSCTSLRRVPSWWYKFKLNSESTTYLYQAYCLYGSAFSSCKSIDEVLDVPVWRCKAVQTNNMFSNFVDNTWRLKDLTFETDNGQPIVTQWKNQTIDFSRYAGFAPASNTFPTEELGYNNGITEDKEVTDDASYQALKNDPDWYGYGDNNTQALNYARYNHDAAVRTLNSLPDTSAYLASAGGTNTIKFKGAAGEKTDAGAINTLTAEEIAVAAAKGWTVTLS